MSLFKKKKKPVFGANIEPNCEYCFYNLGEDEVVCPNKKGDSVCKKYKYDPLKREPMGKPILRNYSEDDFLI